MVFGVLPVAVLGLAFYVVAVPLFQPLGELGQRPPLLMAVRAYYLGHLGKYLPGKAWASGHPVKMVMNRDEVFRATGPTSGAVIDVKLGATKDRASGLPLPVSASVPDVIVVGPV